MLRFSSWSSETYDRQSCNGARGIGEKKTFLQGQSFWLILLTILTTFIFSAPLIAIFKQAQPFIPDHFACFSPLINFSAHFPPISSSTLSPQIFPNLFSDFHRSCSLHPSSFLFHFSLCTLPPRSSQILTDLSQIFYRSCSLHSSLFFFHFSLFTLPPRSSQILTDLGQIFY